MPGPLSSFINDLVLLINELRTQHRMLIDGDFHLDQILREHVVRFDPQIQNFNLSQRSQYSTHTWEKKSEANSSLTIYSFRFCCQWLCFNFCICFICWYSCRFCSFRSRIKNLCNLRVKIAVGRQIFPNRTFKIADKLC